jgi:HEAT repeat protein
MYQSPDLPLPPVVKTFPKELTGLWLQAIDRPEADFRCQAALTIAAARELGMTGLDATVPALSRELGRADQHPSVRLAAAHALIALDAKEAAPALFKAASTGDNDLREIIEPALARWDYPPAREDWLRRLGEPPPHRRGTVLAIEALAVMKEAKAAPRLRELALAAGEPPAVRLAAARALGVLCPTGGEADADSLAADTTPAGMVARLAAASVLRHHSGDGAVRRLQALARDSEPAVAAVALARLVEIDPGLVVPLLTPVLASPDANVRAFGVEVLFRKPTDAHVRLLGDRLNDPHPAVRVTARQHLRELAGKSDWKPGAIREGERLLAGDDWRGREQAAVLLGQLEHKAVATRLAELLADRRPEVAVAAAWGLRKLSVPATLAPALDYFKRYARPGGAEARGVTYGTLDRQLCQLAQLFGAQRYAPAEPAMRPLIPKAFDAPETRAAACWVLGLLHEGKPDPGLVTAMTARLSATIGPDLEVPPVRRMCAVAMGRMKAKDALPTLRKFYMGQPTLDVVSNACGWAIERLTGERVPPPEPVAIPQRAWFLTPAG